MLLYFSATGNSKFVAEKISEILNDEAVDLLPKLRARDTSPMYSQSPWVIVCPVYVAEMPQIVEDWVRTTPLHGNRDIYFVFTAAASMGISGVMEKRYMREKGLNYCGSACIIMPTNYPVFFTVKPESECIQIIRTSIPEIVNVAKIIANGGKLNEDKQNRTLEQSRTMVALTEPIKKLYFSKIVKGSKFTVGSKCISCGKCSRVCPLCNITIVNNRPSWNNNCTHCMACLSNCPVEAIEYGKKTLGKRKYHFPNLDDIMENNN